MGRPLFSLILLASPILNAQNPSSAHVQAPYLPLTLDERIEFFAEGAFASPQALFRAGVSAAFAQNDNSPPEWGQGADAYGRRYASAFTTLLIRDAAESAGAAALGQDPRYERCRCSGLFPRFGHAVASRFVTRNREGKKRFAAARVGAQFVAGMSTVAWYPERYNYQGDGLRFGARLLGFGTISSLVQEFVVQPRH